VNKYHNKRVVLDGKVFDSKKEAERYQVLKMLENANIISNLSRQVPFELVPKQKNERAVKYIADFMYVETATGKIIVEDVKGFKTDVYKLKRKLFKYRYPKYVFIET
jgi:dsDNA-binding SOS-regulon protein